MSLRIFFARPLLYSCWFVTSAAAGVLPESAFRSYGVGTSPTSVAIGDLNGDGREDLAAAGGGDNTVSVLLGNGDGTFGAKHDFGTRSFPQSVVIGDMNADGRPDAAVANSAVPGAVSVLLGNADGTFKAKGDFATGSAPFAVALSDLNGNDDLDLVVVKESSNTVSILPGNGDGTFVPKPEVATGLVPRSNIHTGSIPPDGRMPGLKSGTAAFLYSFVGTAVPVALGAAVVAGSDAGGSGSGVGVGAAVLLGGLVIGPSLGQFYSGRPSQAWTGIGIRSLASVVILAAAVQGLGEGGGNGNEEAQGTAGLALGGASLALDILTAPHSAHFHNGELRPHRVGMMAIPVGGAPGFGFCAEVSF